LYDQFAKDCRADANSSASSIVIVRHPSSPTTSLISLDRLSQKALGIPLGKPKGTIQKSIFDKDREQIVELLRLGVSMQRISTQHMRYGSPSSLSYYIKTRNLREEAAQSKSA
jgi:hypothetical protein